MELSNGDTTKTSDSISESTGAESIFVAHDFDERAAVSVFSSIFFSFNISDEFVISHEGDFLKAFRNLNFRILRCKNS